MFLHSWLVFLGMGVIISMIISFVGLNERGRGGGLFIAVERQFFKHSMSFIVKTKNAQPIQTKYEGILKISCPEISKTRYGGSEYFYSYNKFRILHR